MERITIANGTDYDLDAEVGGRDGQGWLPLAILAARSEAVAHRVIEQGEVWVFRFRHWGDPVGELSLTRAGLERNGWHVDVPAEVEERLRRLGRPASDRI